MERIRYKLSSARLSGYLLITYQNGNLKSILTELKEPLKEVQWFHISSIVTPTHDKFNIAELKKLLLTVEQIDAADDEPQTPELSLPANTRIALFCQYYKKQFNQKYTATKTDGGKLKNTPISQADFEPMLKCYMESKEWYLQPKSIANFIGKINEIKLLMKNPGALAKSVNWPIPFDAGYNNTLDESKRQEYYAALRDAGYRYKDNPGRGGKWEKV